MSRSADGVPPARDLGADDRGTVLSDRPPAPTKNPRHQDGYTLRATSSRRIVRREGLAEECSSVIARATHPPLLAASGSRRPL